MGARSEFDEVYERFSGSRPMYKILEHIKSGIPRWRLQIFEKNAARTGGDMLHLCGEMPTEEACLAAGIKELIRLSKGRH